VEIATRRRRRQRSFTPSSLERLKIVLRVRFRFAISRYISLFHCALFYAVNHYSLSVSSIGMIGLGLFIGSVV